MEAPDPSGAVSSVIRILRKATRIVQLAPFVYLAFYSAYMLLGNIASEEALCVADSLLTISPAITGMMLVGSRLFCLCRWHKTACLLPMSSQVEGYVDSFIITFTQEEIILINTAIGIISLLFLILAIRHFCYGK